MPFHVQTSIQIIILALVSLWSIRKYICGTWVGISLNTYFAYQTEKLWYGSGYHLYLLIPPNLS